MRQGQRENFDEVLVAIGEFLRGELKGNNQHSLD